MYKTVHFVTLYDLEKPNGGYLDHTAGVKLAPLIDVVCPPTEACLGSADGAYLEKATEA